MKTVNFTIIPGANLSFSIDMLGGDNPKTWSWEISDGFSDSGTGDGDESHTIASSNITKNSVFIAHATQTQGGGSSAIHQLKVRYPPGGPLNILGRTAAVFTESKHAGRVTFSTRPEGRTTYLEKLDSMDQYTKSQYTPRRRR